MISYIGISLFSFPLLFIGDRRGVGIFGTRNTWYFLCSRGFIGCAGIMMKYTSFRLLPLADATVIALMLPVFVCIMARLFLREPCGKTLGPEDPFS